MDWPYAAPLAVALVALQVVEVDLADAVHVAAHRDDPGARLGEETGQQPAGEREVTEMVGAELHLEAVGGLALRQRHDPGVVDQDVDRACRCFRRTSRDGGQAREIERAELGVGVRYVLAQPIQRRLPRPASRHAMIT